MRHIFLLFLVPLFSLHSSQTTCPIDREGSLEKQQDLCCDNCPSCGKDEYILDGMYNASARNEVDASWNFFVSGSFLYYLPKQNGLDLGLLTPNDPAKNIGSTIELNEKYQPGFKVGLGFKTDYDAWSLFAQYTRFYTNEHGNKSPASDQTITPFWYDFPTNQDLYTQVRATWRIKLNLFDLTLKRPAYTGKRLLVAPYFGMRGSIIDQRYRFRLDQANLENLWTHSSSSTWSIGPQFGLDTNWSLGKALSLIANGSFSLGYQKTKTFLQQKSPIEQDKYSFNSTKKGEQLFPMLDLTIGLLGKTYFNQNKWFSSFFLGYDFSYFWQQNLMRKLKDTLFTSVEGRANDLILHGLNFTARLDF